MNDVSDILQASAAPKGMAAIKGAIVPYARVQPGKGTRPSAGSQKPERPLPPIIRCVEFLIKMIVPPLELIVGLLHQGSKMVLAGGSKSFKTWVLLDLAVSVAEGKQWLGFNTSKAKVLYINFELQDFSMYQRLNQIVQKKEMLDKPQDLHLWNLRGFATNFDEIIPRIIERVSGEGYGLIIIDPVYKGLGDSDENSASGIGNLMNMIEKLAVEVDAAVVFGAHFSKGNQSRKESIDRMSGSGVFARDPDTIVTMTSHDIEETYTLEFTLRNFPSVKAFCVEWQFPLMVRNDRLDPKNLKDPAKKAVKYTNDQVRDLLDEKGLKLADWRKAAEALGMSLRTFADKKKALKDANQVSEVDGVWKKVQPQG